MELDAKTLNRFWSKVDRSGDCWRWKGASGNSGYGRFKINGKLYSTHRVAYEISRGCVGADLWVLHRCDNRKCVNPGHLFLGTRSDNMRDASQKGRLPQQRNPDNFALSNHSRKLSEAQVIEIKQQLVNARRGDQARLARQYGVTPGTIHQILKGKSYGFLG